MATANFLVAVGCMNTIEFLGGVRNDELGMSNAEKRAKDKKAKSKVGEEGVVESHFKAGVSLLGGEYITFGEGNMYRLRNGLTHQYLLSLQGLACIKIVNDWHADRAIFGRGDELKLNVAKLIVDLGIAWGRLRCQLWHNDEMLFRVRKALERLPKLL